MNKFSNTTINRQFLLVYKKLIGLGLVRSKSDIGRKLGTYNHVINAILDGRRNPTLDMVMLLIQNYKINSNFIFGYDCDMFFDNTVITTIPPKKNIDWKTEASARADELKKYLPKQ